MSKHNDTATLWKHDGLDLYGNPSYAEPVVITVRWEYQTKLITDSQGREIQGQGVIYFPEKVFDIGDYIADGEYTDLTPTRGSFEIKNERNVSNLSGTEREYRALV